MRTFAGRKEAALELARMLEKYKGKNTIILGIPRGGAETAYYMARYLKTEFSLLISRKLGHPINPEYAFGAIAEDGTVYFHAQAQPELSQEVIDEVIRRQKKEIERRVQLLRKGKPLPDIKNKTVILADDGIATGATIFAAIRMCKNKGAARIIVAAPVSPRGIEKELLQEADEVIILEKPASFFAVSEAYDSFRNLTDGEALAFMEKWEKEKQESEAGS